VPELKVTSGQALAKRKPPFRAASRDIFESNVFDLPGLYAFVDRVDSEVRGSGNGR
jgi:hypothetical protein